MTGKLNHRSVLQRARAAENLVDKRWTNGPRRVEQTGFWP